jgi:antitoxin VapB
MHALEERLERLKGCRTTTDVAEEIMRISLRCRALPEIDARSADEIPGYEERGLPQ